MPGLCALGKMSTQDIHADYILKKNERIDEDNHCHKIMMRAAMFFYKCNSLPIITAMHITFICLRLCCITMAIGNKINCIYTFFIPSPTFNSWELQSILLPFFGDRFPAQPPPLPQAMDSKQCSHYTCSACI